MAQWQYANQRRKVSHHLLGTTNRVKINIAIENHFCQLFEIPNVCTKESYDSG